MLAIQIALAGHPVGVQKTVLEKLLENLSCSFFPVDLFQERLMLQEEPHHIGIFGTGLEKIEELGLCILEERACLLHALGCSLFSPRYDLFKLHQIIFFVVGISGL